MSIRAYYQIINDEAYGLQKHDSRDFIKDWTPGSRVEDCILSATIEVLKPGG